MTTATSRPSHTSTGDSPRDSTMRAIVQRAYGSAGTLSLQTVACPAISDTEVLVEVHAAGVDRGTWHLMTGMPYLVRLAGFGLTKPNRLNPGFDVAGRVAAVGSAVTRFAVGDEVFGIARASYAEYAAASQDKLVLKPRQATFEQAAVSTVSDITALQALMDVGKLRPGQSVLVIGASGGVGTFAVQIAKVLGAHVTGVASTAKLDMVRALGAEHVIDYTRDDFATGDSRYDLIIDTGGRNSLGRLRRVLSERGTLVIVGGEGGDRLTGGIGLQLRAKLLSPFVKQRLTTFISKEQRSSIEKLAELIASGEVVPAIGQRFPLEDTAQAIRRLEAGQASGKSVIVVRDQSAEAAH